MSKPPTIHDVAKRAQVSVSTVSNVLTGKRPVAEATRRRVLEIVQEIGFRPNRLAQGLVSRSSQTIGVVASGLEYFGPSRVLVGIEQEASERGYTLILNLIHEPATVDAEAVLAHLITHQVDGIIWASPHIGKHLEQRQEALSRVPAPVVLINHPNASGLIVIDIDNQRGGYEATRHLLANGFQNIGLIAGPPDWHASQMRRQGWELALREAGKEPELRQIAYGDWSPQSGERAFYQLRAAFPELDAVFAANDQMAIGALCAAADLNLRIPEDIGIVGYDDIPEAAFIRPRLSTVRQPLLELGRLAVQKLDAFIAGNLQPSSANASGDLLQPLLIVRESSQLRRSPE